ncbi:MAG: hypothetical protein V1816_16975 [Pseudomonadota bacterium]
MDGQARFSSPDGRASERGKLAAGKVALEMRPGDRSIRLAVPRGALFLILLLVWISPAAAAFSSALREPFPAGNGYFYSQAYQPVGGLNGDHPDSDHTERGFLALDPFGFPGMLEFQAGPRSRPDSAGTSPRPAGKTRSSVSGTGGRLQVHLDPARPLRGFNHHPGLKDGRSGGFFRRKADAGLVMSFNTPLGRFSVGRMSGGEGGRASLGRGDGLFGERNNFYEASPRNVVRFSRQRDSWRLAVAYEKSPEKNFSSGLSESRVEEFWIRPQFEYYGMDVNIGVNLRLAYNRDRGGELSIKSSFSNSAAGPGARYATAGMAPRLSPAPGDPESAVFIYGGRTDLFDFWPAAVFEAGPFAFHASLRYRLGQVQPANAAGSNLDKIRLEGLGLYADAVVDLYWGRLGLGWLSLTGNETVKNSGFTPSGLGRTEKMTNLARTGAGYTPLLVAYDYGLENAGLYDSANHWSVVAWWDQSLTEEIMLHAAYGYIAVNQAPDNVKRDYGHEIDSGLSARLYRSSVFTTTFGYFFPGEYFRRHNQTGKMNDAYVWKNELEIRF